MADPEPWGIKKTAKVVIPLTIVAGLIVYAYLPHDAKLRVSAAKGGECILVPEATVVDVLKKRDCDRAHTGEIYFAFKVIPAEATALVDAPERCAAVPDDVPVEQRGAYERFLDLLSSSDNRLIVLTNNPDPTKTREFACVVAFPEREGSLLGEYARQASQETGFTPG